MNKYHKNQVVDLYYIYFHKYLVGYSQDNNIYRCNF